MRLNKTSVPTRTQRSANVVITYVEGVQYDTLDDLLADEGLTYDAEAGIVAGAYIQCLDGTVVKVAVNGTPNPHFEGAADTPLLLWEAGPNFSTRPRLERAISDGQAWPDGTILSDGKVFYVWVGSSGISDMEVLAPFGDPYADHYGYNETPGTTDMADAINACLSANGRCKFFNGQYAVGSTVSKDNCFIQGESAHGSLTRLIGLSSSLAVGEAVVKIGRSTVLLDLSIEYDSVTGSEAEHERVGIDTSGADYILQRGSLIDRIRITNVGTGIADMGSDVFSVTFGTIEIGAHTYAGVDIQDTTGTGNVWHNIYINDGDTNTPTYGFRSNQRHLGTITQLNVEHAVYSEAAVSFSGAVVGNVGDIHIEGVDLAEGAAYLQVSSSNIIAGVVNMINTRLSNDNCALVDLLDTDDEISSNYESNDSMLQIGVLQTLGIARPNTTIYPDYPSGRRGLDNVSGFKFIRREGYTDDLYKLQVNQHQWGVYSGDTDEADIYRHAITRHSDTDHIDLLRWESKGRIVHPNKNFLSNGDFSDWTSTSETASTGSPAETATGWVANSAASTMDVDQVELDIGSDTDYAIRLDNTAGAGTYQYLKQDVSAHRQMMDKPLVLSFWMKASSAGRVLEQISCSLQNASGTPASEFLQVVSGTSSRLDAITEWQYYEFQFDAVSDADITSYGSAPYYELKFEVNGASADRTAIVDIKKIKLEIGNEASEFSV